jgi:hypothetical protein
LERLLPTQNTILTYFHNFTKKQKKITRKDFFLSKKAKEILGKLLKADNKKVPQARENRKHRLKNFPQKT